ncbi:anti-sigma-D factor RsdA [Rhodococcus indonesiensis]|uniref:Anti-sigma-D factor RsdA n=1 Tax=Rhodococcus indonesiensis TaxID=3055869 RepID=A0ABT7RNJ3_9NOCA|nr:anti-sigma-D factor RsdA [Rhodococcus indonesiensis]MDM7489200.1 anti-sigma-D factor RsdA [Rhodococcus indonesiensis]
MGRKHGADDDFFADLADDGTPVDIAAVRRDDALIDAISGDGPVPTETTEEYELATLLAGWRAEILADPLPPEPDLDEIVAAVNREIGARDALAERRSRSRTQLRLIRPIAGAAALIAIAVGGATAVSYQAEPGDPLWSVKQVVFSEQAESTIARIDTASTLQEAEQRLAVGDTEGAQELIQSAQQRSGSITDAGQRDQLGDWVQRLTTELSKLLPPPPPPVLPAPPVQSTQVIPAPAPTTPTTPSTVDPTIAGTTPGTGTVPPATSSDAPGVDLVPPSSQPAPSPSPSPVTTPPPLPSTEPTSAPVTPEPTTVPTAAPTTTPSASAPTPSTSLEQQSISQTITVVPAPSE